MAEADIDTIEALADGASGYGAALRGAMTTLQTRQTAAQATALAVAAVNGDRPLYTQTHSASGAMAINWANGNYFRVNSAGFNITGITETNAPTGATMREGVVEIVNTHGSTTITVDLTSIGMSDPFTVAAGATQVVWLISTPAI